MKTFPKSTEQIQDIVAALLVEGTGVTLAYNDGAGTLTISSSVDLTGYATTAYVDDEVSANGVSLQAFASNASNLSTGTVADARLSANVALTTNPLSQFAATTSDQLRGVISDETGTGALVFAGGNIGAATATSISNSAAAVQIGHATQGWSPIGPVSNAMKSHQGHWSLAWHGIAGSASAQMVVGGHLGFAAAFGAGGAIDTRLTRASAGVLSVLASTSTADSTTLGSLNLANLTASGVAKFTGYPTSLLPAAASNAGSITYDTTISKHVGCNGSSWNALW